jgi:site-specific DNA-methyltransferase (adenine-specific)
MKEFPDKSIDMILCDLPYGITACKWDVVIPLEPSWKQYKRIIKDNVAIVLACVQPFATMLIQDNIKMFKYEWIWSKSTRGNFLNANKQPLRIHENILVFCDGQSIYNAQGLVKSKEIKNRGSTGTNYGNAKDGYAVKYRNYPVDILEFPNDYPKLHPTQKPVALFEYLIKTYTNEGAIVLDNCCGSGTTGIACQNTNRNFILIDKDPHWCDVAYQRLMENRDRLSNA